MRINKHDTNGTKPLLGKGELGYDDYTAGGDAGRVYVGNGSANIAMAKKSEVDAKVTANANITAGTYKSVTVDVKGLVTGGTNPTTLGGYGITDTYTKTETNTQISTAVNGLVDAAPGTLDTLNELAAALGDDPNFATTIANSIGTKVTKVTSTNKAIVRFNGTTGEVQNSGVIIDDNGNLSISSKLNVGYNGYTTYAYGYLSCYNSNLLNFVALYPRNTVGTDTVFQANINGEYMAGILSDGSFNSKNQVYGGTSDAKLKENVVDSTPKLDKLMQVQVRNFNFIGQEDKQIGVIAQEIEQIFPSVVYETKDTKQVEVTKERIIPAVEEVKDEEGNVITEAKPESIEEYTEIETQETGEVTKNVKYSIIYMMMLKGMQEMRAEYTAEIQSLKDELAVLKGAK